MSQFCINCNVFLGPVLVSLGLIIWGVSSKLINWDDLKDREVMISVIGIVLLALSFVWLLIQLFHDYETNYLRLFSPALIGLAVTCVGVFHMRHDMNFSGADRAYAGIVLFCGSLFWIFWILEVFT